jgi:ATP adenylyltransferase
VFCENVQDSRDNENLIIFRGKHNFVVMNPFPYNNGHLMVLPYCHVATFEGLEDDVLLDFMNVIQLCIDCLNEVMMPEGFNAGVNFGKVAGAGLGEHVHLHIVPRWTGDASFITVIGETKVIPEHITKTFEALHPVFRDRGKSII